MYVIKHSKNYKELTKNNKHYLCMCKCGCIFTCTNDELIPKKVLDSDNYTQCPECKDYTNRILLPKPFKKENLYARKLIDELMNDVFESFNDIYNRPFFEEWKGKNKKCM